MNRRTFTNVIGAVVASLFAAQRTVYMDTSACTAAWLHSPDMRINGECSGGYLVPREYAMGIEFQLLEFNEANMLGVLQH